MHSARRRTRSVHILLQPIFQSALLEPPNANRAARTFEIGSESKVRSQGIIDQLVGLGLDGDDVVELCGQDNVCQ